MIFAAYFRALRTAVEGAAGCCSGVVSRHNLILLAVVVVELLSC